MTDPSKPSWRRGRSDGGRGPGAAGKGWQSRQPKTSRSAASNHRAKLFGLGLLVVGLAAYFLAKVFFIPVKTPLLVVVATEYPASIPPNGFAQEDAARLAATNADNIQAADSCSEKVTRDSLFKYLDEQLQIRAGGPNKDVLLLYLSAHGAMNDQGDPCLLLADSSPVDASTWLKFSDILERLKQRNRGKVVLLLDAGRIDDDWSLGVLYNGFVEQLERQLAEARIPNLFVVSSTSGGERAWVAPELGASVFGYFAVLGLSDAAGNRDELITLRELADFLAEQVSGWVGRNRASTQIPRLLTPLSADQDFAVAYRGKSPESVTGRATASDQQRMAADWQAVSQAWRQFEQRLQERKLLRYEPIAVAQVQRLLSRMHQLILAGAAYRAEFEAAQAQVRTLLETDPRSRLPPELQAFSVPLQRQVRDTAGGPEAWQTVLAKWIEAKGPPQIKEGEPPQPALDYFAASRVALQFVRQLSPPGRREIREALAFVDKTPGRLDSKGRRIPEVSELLMLRMVDAYVDVPAEAAEFALPARRYLQRVLAARELAEQAAAPEDERAHHWVQQLVDSADTERRAAEDLLFVDTVSAAADAGTNGLLESGFSFAAQYDAAIERGQKLTAAYSLRDEIWFGLPFLANWLLRAEPTTRQRVVGGDGNLAAAAAFVQQLAEQNHELAAMLDRMLTDNQFESPSLPSSMEKLRGDWDKLRESFVAHCQELKDRAGQDKPTMREIGEALRAPSPFLSTDERDRLATKFQNILFATAALSDGMASGAALGPQAAGDARLAALGSLPLHPALTLLDRSRLPLLLNPRSPAVELERKGDSDLEWLATQGARVRKWLADVPQAAKDLEDVTNRRLEEATETAANSRAGISEADRLVRAAAAWVSRNLPDPAHRLRRVDLHLEYLWHARRSLDDYWGPVPGTDRDAASYFDAVTRNYLDAARRLDDTPKSLVHRRVDLEQLLADRRAAIAGTRVEPQDVRTLGELPVVQQQIHVAWHKDLPGPGSAALWLEGTIRESQPELIPVTDRESKRWRRQFLPVGQSPSVDIVQGLPAQQLTAVKKGQELVASVLYRGHRIRSPFAVRGPEIVLTSAVDPRTPRRAKVTVRGEGNRRAYILFIFDCSGSMNEGGRLAKAVMGLSRVLDALRGDEHYHVGLYAYGHRSRFDEKNRQWVGPDDKPVNINPDLDVELLLPAEPLTDEHCNALTRRLNQLKAIGVTPLYYSIQTASQSDEFRLARPEDLKHVIVITDGIDYQFKERTTIESVRKTLRENPQTAQIRVDVVLFDTTANILSDRVANSIARERNSTVAQELKDIQSVPAATGGEFFSAENPDQLTEALRRALKLVKYSVAQADASISSGGERVDLGKDWPLLDLNPPSEKYLVRLHGTTQATEQLLTIEGGESIELQYDKTEERLVFPPYRRSDAREPVEDLADPQTSERYRVLPILPHKKGSRVEFQVAIQNVDRLRFTPRPRHVWAEIQPLSDADQPVSPARVFYDAQFVAETPVPVLQFVVLDWPAGATKGALRLWLKFDFPPLKPNGTALAEELNPVIVEEDIPQVTFRAEIQQVEGGGRGWRLTVWEQHEPATSLFTARVQTSPVPDQIRHSFFVGVDTAKHEFDYADKPGPTVIVTARERITQNAIVVPRVVMQVIEN